MTAIWLVIYIVPKFRYFCSNQGIRLAVPLHVYADCYAVNHPRIERECRSVHYRSSAKVNLILLKHKRMSASHNISDLGVITP